MRWTPRKRCARVFVGGGVTCCQLWVMGGGGDDGRPTTTLISTYLFCNVAAVAVAGLWWLAPVVVVSQRNSQAKHPSELQCAGGDIL